MRLRLLGLLIALAAFPASTPRLASAKGGITDWADSEVRYLLLDEERAEWKDLKDDAQREAFVTRFWARRDPDPATPANEYQEEIARRLAAANRLFHTEGRPGWLTDRGRIYLTFGTPDDVAEDAAGTVEERGSLGSSEGIARGVTRGSITWTYHRLVGWNAPPNQRFVFSANQSGGYNLTRPMPADWKQVSPATGKLAPAPRVAAAPAEPRRAGGDRKDGPANAREREQLLAALAGTGPKEVVIETRALTFPVGQKEALVVVQLTVAPAEPAAPLEILAGAFRDGDKSAHAAVMPLAAASSGSLAPRSFAFLLAPGSYRLALVAREPATGKPLGGTSAALEVPAYSDGKFRASSVVLASEVRQLEAARPALDQIVDGIVIGNIGLLVPAGNRYPTGSSIDVFLLLAGARPTAAGALDVAADYRLRKDGELKSSFPTQTVAGSVSDQPIPLTGLDPGAYRLEIDLTDRPSGSKVSESLDFVIE